ncbi:MULTISPECIES: NAD(P)H-dependent flavin oxidoreductase [Brachybacterium]|uniref:Propionate 3-nitronate monooxygenase n=1 Tax=Brachybacterium alimentarium TaxID=47845 RepID=A0A2A3YGJ6_9MICO|nr:MULTISPECIES: nitronate monooxygenase [Brachybacterium]PCC38215.1 2-nitropropane dioxygenase [Brachybacterium alimentarium]RCS63983.1 nitronate monooxygenase [Brachybacterium sp. JB7]RCS75438.1 nitronate monooxygenase [Brachybacterium alimentarium]RCS86769.1 nitronate monooxygenase [Brachybacterium alimentarium]RCS91029.1 nitronate monooxygenase [Brachybacterium alimentarium]
MMRPLLRSRLPLVAAPMAGGPSTVALARAVSSAGAFPFLAGGNTTADALGAEIDEARRLDADFGVNLFALPPRPIDEAAFTAYAAELAEEAAALGVTLEPAPRTDDDSFDEKLELLTRSPVPVVSFTFALPLPEHVAALQAVRSTVLASVTTPQEARAAAEIGVDGLVVQGPDAGGHSATHDPSRTPAPISTPELVRQVVTAVDLPVIGAGGVDGPVAVHRILAAGAQGVAVGTLLLRTDEAGTSPTHRAALADASFTSTSLTRAFTGRPARSLHNAFLERHDASAPTGYPAIHHLTRELRRAAGRAGDADRLHLWAGTGWRHAPEGSAADVIRWLAKGV